MKNLTDFRLLAGGMVVSALLIGCSDASDDFGGSAAKAGTAGTAGAGTGGAATGGAAGSSKGGSGGSATGGLAGSATGGTGGAAGSSKGGSGGSATAGSAGSATGGTGGAGGTAGTTGVAGSGGAAGRADAGIDGAGGAGSPAPGHPERQPRLRTPPLGQTRTLAYRIRRGAGGPRRLTRCRMPYAVNKAYREVVCGMYCWWPGLWQRSHPQVAR